MAVTERRHAHVAQTDGGLAGAVGKEVVVVGVELGRRDHLREGLYIGRLQVHNVCRQTQLARWPVIGDAVLKDCSFEFRSQMLIRRSSADRKISPSGLIDTEWMW